MLIDTLKKENMIALKDKNEAKRGVLSVVINKYMVLGYENKAKGIENTDADLVNIINKTLKELNEEKEGYQKVGRTEDVKKIEEQINTISGYLPQMMSKEEILVEINKLEDKSIPSVMKHFKANFNGKCDMKLVSEVLKSL